MIPLSGVLNSISPNKLSSPSNPADINFNRINNVIKDFNNPQGAENISQMAEGFNKIDFSAIPSNDMQLKTDLEGFVQKNQEYSNAVSDSEGLNAGAVADKFSNVLGNYLNNVNSKSKAAEKAVETFASGGNIDLHSVMIATEKANLSLELAVQMRNKMIQAYQEISRIQV